MIRARTAVAAVSICAALACGVPAPPAPVAPPARPASVASLPLAFEANEGQTDAQALFVAHAGRCTAFLTQTGAVFAGRAAPLVMSPAGGAVAPRVEGVRELPGRVNSYIGNDPHAWRTGIRTFAAVAYRDVWPGVDLVFHGDLRELEYDFVVAPGADASGIALRFDGAEDLVVDAAGDLVIGLDGGEVRQRRPVVYEECTDGTRRDVAGRYVVRGRNVVAFEVDDRDAANRLVIDPVLVYGTYVGGTDGEYPPKVAVDADGGLVVASHATSADFPTVRAFQAAKPGPNQVYVVAKLNAAGSALVYATYLGGTDGEQTYPFVAVDGQRNAYIAGNSSASDYPTTAGAYQTSAAGDSPIVVTKLGPSGTLTWSTYFDANAPYVQGVAVDGTGNTYVTGYTSTNGPIGFPTTPGAFQTSIAGFSDTYVVKLNAAGSDVVYSTLLGGDANDLAAGIAVDAAGDAYVCGSTQSSNFPTRNAAQAAIAGGSDWFVTKLNPGGTDIVYSTFVGGPGGATDVPYGVAADATGRAYVVGNGNPFSLPGVPSLVPARQQTGMLVRLSAAGALDFVTGVVSTSDTFVGTSTAPQAVAVDGAGDVYVGGVTAVSDMPEVCAVSSGYRSGTYDAFVVKMKGDASAFVYSTYLGGSGFDYCAGLAVSPAGEAFVGVGTKSHDITLLSRSIEAIKPGPDSNYSWYLAKLSAEDGTGPGGCAPPEPPRAVDSFVLPSSVKSLVNKKSAAKSKLTAAGVVDFGSVSPDLAQAATIDVGNLHFGAMTPVKKGKTITYKAPGMTFTLTPGAAGSSRAAFKLAYAGDFTRSVRQDGEVRVHFGVGDADCAGFVKLAAGVFVVGKSHGALVEPNLVPVVIRGTLVTPGSDALAATFDLATDGTTPSAPADFTFGIEGHFSVTFAGTEFVRKGSVDTYSVKNGAQGTWKVVVDYAKQTVAVTAAGPNIRGFSDGSNVVTMHVTLGGVTRTVSVRAVQKGTKLTY